MRHYSEEDEPHYTSGEYFEKCQMLRKYFAYPAITTDVIVGFPGETDEEFETTRAFIEKVGFYETHVFKYSRRNGDESGPDAASGAGSGEG